MARVDPDKLSKLSEALAVFFYALMFLAFVCAVAGSPGSGFLLLIFGACSHVARVGVEAYANEPRRALRPSRAALSRSRG